MWLKLTLIVRKNFGRASIEVSIPPRRQRGRHDRGCVG
jgi:hypothetical protein